MPLIWGKICNVSTRMGTRWKIVFGRKEIAAACCDGTEIPAEISAAEFLVSGFFGARSSLLGSFIARQAVIQPIAALG